MKNKLLLISLLALFIISSCTKEENTLPSGIATTNTKTGTTQYGKCGEKATRDYKESFNATSTITPTATGIFNPGTGKGHATHFGDDARICFNQLVLLVNGNPVGSVAAPVNQFYATKLAASGVKNVPNTVSSITYDEDGNSVWFTSSTGTSLAPVSATKVNFSATLSIIGGTGKFSGATGQVTMTGYFNPQSANQAAVMETSGTITY